MTSCVAAARLAAAGAKAPRERIAAAWHDAYGAPWAEPDGTRPAIERNWIKAWPCCLQTHGAIECAASVAEVPDGELTVVAHPVSRQAAAYDDVATPLEAKFSIPYTTAFTLLHGEPGVDAFAAVDDEARELARRVRVRMDPSLAESELALLAGGTELARVHAARGSPERPMSAEQLAAKVGALAGDRLEAAFSGDQRPVEWVLDLIKGTRGS